MAITWGDIQNWKHGNLNTAMQDLATLRKGLAEGKSAASKAQGQIQSTGAAANGAKASLGKLVDELGERVDDATELGLATSEAAEGVWDVETKVHECTSFVAQYPYLSIDGDGGVHWENVTPTSFIDMPSLDLSQVTNSTSGLEAGINLVDPAGPGFMAGGAAGAIGGSLLGPVGTVVGGVNGAVGGGIASTIGKGLSLSSSGPIGSFAENREREQKAQELKALIDAALERAGEVDAAYVKRLVGVRDGTYDHSKLRGNGPQIKMPWGGSIMVPDEEGKPWPPQGVDSPTEVSNWWNSLTEEERREFMEKNPDAIRNLDGMPASVRDEANRKVFPRELGEARDELEAARKSGDSERIAQAQRKVQDMEAIEKYVDPNCEGYKTDHDGKPYKLLGLDTSGNGDVRAIVASGDVDKASNVGVLVPGIGTTARKGLNGLVSNADQLRQDSGADHTATVAYLNYDAPPGVDPSESQNGSFSDIASTQNADKGAPKLNSFYEGMQSWHESQGNDPRIATFDHSYGSLLGTTAARDTKVGVLDAMGVFGSPGGRADSVHEYNVADGQVYASANKWDPVAGVGSDEFGRDPNTLDGVKHMASNDRYHDYWGNPEFREDAAQILNGEDSSVDRPDNKAEAATKGH